MRIVLLWRAVLDGVGMICVAKAIIGQYCANIKTHLPLGKIAAISQTIFSDAFSWMKLRILIQISLKCLSDGQIENIQAVVQIMAWRRRRDKPLSEPKLNRSTDVYLRHLREMSKCTHMTNYNSNLSRQWWSTLTVLILAIHCMD